MKKILASAIASLFLLANASYAGEIVTSTGVPGTTVTGTQAGTVDFYTQMRLVQEKLAALKAKQDTTLGNVDQIQAELNSMQADFQARLNAATAPFKEQFAALYTLPDNLMTPEIRASKAQIDAINAEIQRIAQERDAKSRDSGALQAYLDAAKKVSDFDVAKVARVNTITKQATDAIAAVSAKYNADFGVLYKERGTFLAKVYGLKSALAKTTDPVKIESLNKDILANQASADALKVRMDALGTQLGKDIAAIRAVKDKALAAINAERKVLVAARDKANATLVTLIRPYNVKISNLFTKLSLVSVPYNTAMQEFVKTTASQRQALSQQMEATVMAIQSEYFAQVTNYLRSKGLI